MKDQDLSHRLSALDQAIKECRESITLLVDKVDQLRVRLENPEGSRERELNQQVKALKERNKDE